MQGYHRSVLSEEILDFLQVKKDHWYSDCTLGDGGHSIQILEKGGRVIGIDQDPQALVRAQARFEQAGIDSNRYKLVRGNFGSLEKLTDKRFDGIVFDLGVSSLQLDDGERGFSFNKEAPLDMRMDPEVKVKALDLVNALHGGELLMLFEKFGEVKDKRVVDAIVTTRKEKPIETTTELASIIEKAVRFRREQSKIHPATIYFQALRIAVNDELNSLTDGLPQAVERLEKNGNLCVISFHSLEDRIVKNLFRSWANEGVGEIITDKPLVPTEQEVKINPRSRSAKLRVLKKL